MLSFAEEFKNFALKGNVIDLAVGVIIGGAFRRHRQVARQEYHHADREHPHSDRRRIHGIGTFGPVLVGQFLGDVLNFLIIALALFLFIVKFLGWILRTKKEAPPPPLTKDQELLIEIRDLLKSQRA